MHRPIHRRQRPQSGVPFLPGKTRKPRPPGPGKPRLPTSARLRRDIGLPEIEEVPVASGVLRRRT